MFPDKPELARFILALSTVAVMMSLITIGALSAYELYAMPKKEGVELVETYAVLDTDNNGENVATYVFQDELYTVHLGAVSDEEDKVRIFLDPSEPETPITEKHSMAVGVAIASVALVLQVGVIWLVLVPINNKLLERI